MTHFGRWDVFCCNRAS